MHAKVATGRAAAGVGAKGVLITIEPKIADQISKRGVGGMGLITVEVSVEDLPITPTLVWCGTPLFDVDDAIRLVDYCKKNNIVVLGVEGFKIKGGKRIPDMDCIVDFSASLNEVCFAVKSIEASRIIIVGIRGGGIFMEFVLVRI